MQNRKPIEMCAIAELVFLTATEVNFPRIAAEMQRAVQVGASEGFDSGLIDDTQCWITAHGSLITLSLFKEPRRGVCVSLTLSVGPLPGDQSQNGDQARQALAQRLLDRLQSRICADQTHWLRRSAPDQTSAEVIGFDAPPSLRPEPVKVTANDLLPLPVELSLVAANDQPDLPLAKDLDLARLRDALYFQDEATLVPAEKTDQMRLAIYTMNTTLVVVALPVGAAMLTYSLIRGGNLRATANALVATGIGIAMLQGPMLQNLLALVG